MNESIFDRIQAILNNYPSITYKYESDTIEIPNQTENGFSIFCYINPDDNSEYTLQYDNWHEHFSTETEEERLLWWFLFGLTDKCQLQVKYAGTFEYLWSVYEFQNNKWNHCFSTGLIFFPFWKKRTVKIFQNNLIPFDDLDEYFRK